MIQGATIQTLLEVGEADRIAIADQSGAGVNYEELRRLIQQTHCFLSNRGIRKTDVVAVALKNDPNTAVLFLALACHCRMAPVVSICCIALLRLELCLSTGRSRPVAHRQLPES